MAPKNKKVELFSACFSSHLPIVIFQRSLLAQEREELLKRRVSRRVWEQLVFCCLPKFLQENRKFVIFLFVCVFIESHLKKLKINFRGKLQYLPILCQALMHRTGLNLHPFAVSIGTTLLAHSSGPLESFCSLNFRSKFPSRHLMITRYSSSSTLTDRMIGPYSSSRPKKFKCS